MLGHAMHCLGMAGQQRAARCLERGENRFVKGRERLRPGEMEPREETKRKELSKETRSLRLTSF